MNEFNIIEITNLTLFNNKFQVTYLYKNNKNLVKKGKNLKIPIIQLKVYLFRYKDDLLSKYSKEEPNSDYYISMKNKVSLVNNYLQYLNYNNNKNESDCQSISTINYDDIMINPEFENKSDIGSINTVKIKKIYKKDLLEKKINYFVNKKMKKYNERNFLGLGFKFIKSVKF